MNLEDRIRNHLHEHSEQLTPAGGGVDAAIGRSRQRRQRSVGLVAGVMLFAVAGLGVAFIGGSGDDGPSEATLATEGVDGSEQDGAEQGVAENAAEDVALADEAASGSVSATTLAVEGASSSSYIGAASFGTDIVVDDGVYYTISTAPGEWTWDGIGDPPPPPDQAIYRSENGRDWDHEVVAGNWIARLDANDGVLYALGTVPGSAPNTVPTLRLGESSDDGASFATSEIAVPFQAPTHSLPYSVNLASSLAAGDAGTVVAAQVSTWVDVWSILTEAEMMAGLSVEPGPDGISIIDYSAVNDVWAACDEAMQAMEAELAEAAEVIMGDPFDEVPACIEAERLAEDVEPDIVEVRPWSDYGATEDDAFGGASEGALWIVGADGTATAVSWPFGEHWLESLTAVDGGYVATTIPQIWHEPALLEDDGHLLKTELWTSDDGVNWTAGAVPISETRTAGSIDGRLVLLGSGDDGEPAAAVANGNGGFDLVSIAPANANGAWMSVADVGQNGAAFVLETWPAVEEPVGDVEGEWVETGPTYTLYVSADGMGWSSAPLPTADGQPLTWINGLAVSDDSVLIWGVVQNADFSTTDTVIEVPLG